MKLPATLMLCDAWVRAYSNICHKNSLPCKKGTMDFFWSGVHLALKFQLLALTRMLLLQNV